MKAVIMAGGQRTRLRPLTSDQPKPMIRVANVPCMEHIRPGERVEDGAEVAEDVRAQDEDRGQNLQRA